MATCFTMTGKNIRHNTCEHQRPLRSLSLWQSKDSAKILKSILIYTKTKIYRRCKILAIYMPKFSQEKIKHASTTFWHVTRSLEVFQWAWKVKPKQEQSAEKNFCPKNTERKKLLCIPKLTGCQRHFKECYIKLHKNSTHNIHCGYKRMVCEH